MKRLLIDTSVWIEFLRGTGSTACVRLRKAITDDEPIVVPGLVRAELLRGVQTEPQATVLSEQLNEYDVSSPEEPQTYEHAATLYRMARARGFTVRSTVDCILAALAAEGRDVLVHCDRDFDALAMVASFQCETW
ncbi:MAG: PIN domain nuclease [Myxococcota bacterium]